MSCNENSVVKNESMESVVCREMNSDADSTTTTTTTSTTSLVSTIPLEATKPNIATKTNNGFLFRDATTTATPTTTGFVMYSLDCLLSTVWVTLCSILVYKYQELVTVFFVFASCFIGSGIISFGRKSLFNTPINHWTNPTTKHMIGFIVFTLCIVKCIFPWLMLSISPLDSFVQMEYEYNNGDEHSNDLVHERSIYISLSISAGYLAYDHWYTALYCRGNDNHRRYGKQPRLVVVEAVTDAIALTMMLINLVSIVQRRQLAVAMTSESKTLLSSTQGKWTYHFIIVLTWLLYKLIRSIIHLGNSTNIRFEETTNKRYSFEKQNIQQQPQKQVLVWNIYGNQYDLSDYVQKHPGGVEAIMLGANRDDCTALFQSYHPFTIHNAKRVLSKYQIKTKQQKSIEHDTGMPFPSQYYDAKKNASSSSSCISSNTMVQRQHRHQNQQQHEYLFYHENDLFYQEICQRVERTLKDMHSIDPIKDRTATNVRIVYYIVVTIALVGTCYWHCTGSIVGSFLFAVFGWLIGSLGHDSGHFATSHISYINDIGVWAMSLLCNPIMWQHQHTYAHHSHTNEYGHDPDLHHFDMLLRVHRKIQYHSLHKNQAHTWYVLFGYAFVCFGTCFWIPWGMMCTGSLYGIVQWTDRKRFWRAIGMYVHFLWYIGLIMITPFFVHRTWLNAVAAVVIHIATSGLLFAFFSQINHLTELCLENEPVVDSYKDNNTIRNVTENQHEKSRTTTRSHQREKRHPDTLNSWAAKQITSSNNFCPNSYIWYILSNGLNLQIEHHLFPGLNHCHLMTIQPAIEQVCKEYGVEYKCYNSWYELIQTTFQWLQRLSVNDDV